jgi:hypothetical protein
VECAHIQTGDAGPFVLDIGGEGRHEDAWNLNPRALRTVGSCRGEPIPRLILGRGEAIPLPDRIVDVVIVERTPLWPAMLGEIRRVVKPAATVILRHVSAKWFDPHNRALADLRGAVARRPICLAGQHGIETVIRLGG